MNSKVFELRYKFDGDFKKILRAIQKGEAIRYNEKPYPIPQSYMQGENIILPLPHRTIIIDLSQHCKQLKKYKELMINMEITNDFNTRKNRRNK